MKRKEAAAVLVLSGILLTAGCGKLSAYTDRVQERAEAVLGQDAVPSATENGTEETAAGPETAAEGSDAAKEEAGAAMEGSDAAKEGAGAAMEGSDAAKEGAGTAIEEAEAAADGTAETQMEGSESEAAGREGLGTEENPETGGKILESLRGSLSEEALARIPEADRAQLVATVGLTRQQSQALEQILRVRDYAPETLCMPLETGRETDGETVFFLGERETDGQLDGMFWLADADSAKELKAVSGAARIESAAGGVLVFWHGGQLSYDPQNQTGKSFDPETERERGAGRAALPYLFYLEEGTLREAGCVRISRKEIEAIPEAAAWLQEQQMDTGEETADREYEWFRVGEDIFLAEIRTYENSSERLEAGKGAYCTYETACFWRQEDGSTEVLETDGRYLPGKEAGAGLPDAWAGKQIGSLESSLSAGERRALEQIGQRQAYDARTLCMIWAEDYDGDGKREYFAALGSYDFGFGKPCCDLWYVDGGDSRLVESGVFAAGGSVQRAGQERFFLLQTCEGDPFGSRMYQVRDGQPERILAEAMRIAGREDGSLQLWIPVTDARRSRTDGSWQGVTRKVYDYRYREGAWQPWPRTELTEAELASYENGAVIAEGIKQQYAPWEVRYYLAENHKLYADIMVSGQDGFDDYYYETYLVRENYLIPVERGEGRYGSTAASGDAQAAKSAEPGTTAQAAENTEPERTSEPAESTEPERTSEPAENTEPETAAEPTENTESETAEGAE